MGKITRIYFFLLPIIVVSCNYGHVNNNKVEKHDSVNSKSTYQEVKLSWYDLLMADYLKHTNNELIKLALKDSTVTEEWLLDDVRHRDSATYMVFHIGHDMQDEDGKRFVTDGWIFIDTLTRKIYEDSPNDSLIEWKK